MQLAAHEIFQRIERCLDCRERLSVGEVEVLQTLRSRSDLRQSITFAEEQQVQLIERKLGLA